MELYLSLGHKIKMSMPPALRMIFRAGQRLRFNITPNHFYSDIPDMRQLQGSTSWRKRMSLYGMPGVDMDEQVAFLNDCCTPVAEQMNSFDIRDKSWAENGEAGYGNVEPLLLYAFLRRHKPGKIRQIGCGASTSVCLRAAADEAGYDPTIECLEPYPTRFLREKAAANQITLKAQPAQDTPADEIADLEAGDLLFIDSTHTIKIGSEVVHIILEVLPRLKPGVFVHFHDITFPYDYSPKTLTQTIFFWRETTLLAALLTNNPGFRILCSMSMLHVDRADQLKQAIPVFNPAPLEDGLLAGEGHIPSSIFIKTQ